ncbi:hypothetical protein SLS60_011061 [Paraconiothyrium brasiliense]|uniref:ABM domain-containing protein n=1 Tax=Paraconiothyrium brasiliense TaxID=300254 RepID=A0ABR3QKG0_9PLEO
MAPRFALPVRLPIRTFRAPARFNSNTSTRAARVIEMAAQAEKPSALEAGVPVMWAVCGGLIYTAWNRVEERDGAENVQKVLSAFHKIIQFTQPHEPDVLRYIATLPADDTTGTVLYMIEEYASQAASDAHLATQPVQDLIQLFSTTDVLAQPPEVHTSTVTASKLCSPPPAISTSPCIVLAHFDYAPGKVASALQGWADVVDYVSKNEYWTRGYTVGEEKDKNSVRTVETYESWEVLEKVHLKDEAIAKNQRLNGRDRLGEGAVRVVAVDGFLGREGRARL